MNLFARRPRAAPDGLVAAVLLSFLATAGFMYVNIMPAIVEGLQTGLHFSAAVAGRIGSANVYGAAVGALLATLLVTRWPWRRTAYALLLLLIGVDVASMFVGSSTALLAIRALHGTVGGCLVGFSFSVIARTAHPERAFGVLLVVQGGLGGLGVMVLPRLVPMFGTAALFAALALFSLATLAMVPFLAAYPRRDEPATEAASRAAARVPAGLLMLAMALLSVFLFQFSNMLLFSYIIGLARHYALDPLQSATVVGVSTWIGMLGSVLVVVLGTRYGRVRMLTVALLFTALGMYVLHGSANPVIYALANVGTGITWGFVIAHLLGMCARCDTTGRAAALGGFASKMGLASGPFVGSLLLGADRYGLLIDVATLVIIACTVAALLPAARLDRLDARLAAQLPATDVKSAGA
ncbi:MAG: MFS transporter [Proteobacteria bacterium]|nr:MFS transporter [Pseudomonadota bacterium]